MINNIVLFTVYFSIFMQFTTGVIQLDGLTLKLPEEHLILKDVLKLETLVQFIEAVFYVWLVFNFKNIKTMASKRYYDWIITTPAMLLATIIYMEYLSGENNKELTFWKFNIENKINIIKIFISNALMLLFGYLGEINKITMIKSVGIGMIFFLYTFYIIWSEYAQYSSTGQKLFLFLFVVWGLYAVAALMKPKYKNIGYNLLDIVSKNFYGVYIYYIIKQLSIR